MLEEEIKKHLIVWTSFTRDCCLLEFDVVNLTSKEVGKTFDNIYVCTVLSNFKD